MHFQYLKIEGFKESKHGCPNHKGTSSEKRKKEKVASQLNSTPANQTQ
jgi:hypothetical protein